MNKTTLTKVAPVLWEHLHQVHLEIQDTQERIRVLQDTLNSFVRVVVFATIMVAWAILK